MEKYCVYICYAFPFYPFLPFPIFSYQTHTLTNEVIINIVPGRQPGYFFRL